MGPRDVRLSTTYGSHWVAEENEPRRRFGEIISQIFHFRVDFVVLRPDFLGLCIDNIYHT